jgi:hypothetical protein
MSIAKLVALIKAVAGSGGGGSGGGSLVIHKANDTLDKTWQEICNAYGAGTYCVLITDRGGGDEISLLQSTVDGVDKYDEDGNTFYNVVISDMLYTTDTANGYPVLEGGE